MRKVQWVASHVTFVSCLLMLVAQHAGAEVVHVFMADGQSNAKAIWATGIEDALTASGLYNRFEVIHVTHPGSGMGFWWSGGAAGFYEEDFYNPSGTGTLEVALQAIEDAGDTWVFDNFFWFQGEGDTVTGGTLVYADRFNGMLGQLQTDLGMPTPVSFTMGIIDANQDPSFDDNLIAIGRTRASVEALRDVQNSIANDSPFGHAIDTRPWPRADLWHVPVAGPDSPLQDLGSAFGSSYLASVIVLGDMNGDFNVTLLDVPLLIEALTNRTAYDAHLYDVNADVNGDVNGDNTFDLGDLAAFSALFASATATSVPEPSSFLLATCALLGLAYGRRRGRTEKIK